MKHKNAIRWSIIPLLFILTAISSRNLYQQPYIQQKLFSASADTTSKAKTDSALKRRTVLAIKDSCIRKELQEDYTAICRIDFSLTDSTLAQITLNSLGQERAKYDSLISKKEADLDTISKHIAAIDSTIEKLKTEPTSEISAKTIILLVVTVFLLTTLIMSFVFLSGILKLHKKTMKMENEFKTANTPIANNPTGSVQPEDKPQKSDSGIAFDVPKPILSYDIKRRKDSPECVWVEIKSDLEQAEIKYCFSEDTSKIMHYDSPIEIGRNCIILAKGQCGKSISEQLEIRVDLSKVPEEKAPEGPDTAGTKPGVSNGGDEPEGGATKPTQTIATDSPKPSVPAEDKRVRVFTNQANVLGISYQGDNHIKAKPQVPCQDCHSFTKVNDVWSIAIVSDGAGSKEHSDIGSNAVCAAFNFYLSKLLENSKHFANGNIPNEKVWDLEFRAILTRFQSDLKTSEKFKSYDFASLAATIVILAYSPKGYLFAHVGDGRAGVKINGTWKSILTPHKGEEANQTIFSTTVEFANKPTMMMSGVFVPETKVEEGILEAFVLMSDGCEDGAWTTYQRVNLPDGDFKVEDVNQPRPQTLDELMTIMDCKPDVQKQRLVEFITGHNKGFKTEGDDKTILIGRAK